MIQTQKGRQNKKTKKYAPGERTREIPIKELNETEGTKVSDSDFKTMVLKFIL